MNPDQLLQQIRDLLTAYLDLGEDTPVAAEVQALAGAIDAQTGQEGAPAEGAPPMGQPEGAAPPDPMAMGMGAVPPPPGGPTDEVPEDSYSGGSMDEARAGAKDFLQRKKKAKAL